MDQVSKPMLGLLLATVGLAGTWMVALRPHSEKAADVDAPLVAPPHNAAPKKAVAPKHTSAPGAEGLGRAIDHAKDATATAERSNAKTETAVANTEIHDAPAVGAAPAKPATPAPAQTAPAPAETSAPASAKTTAPAKPAAPAKPVPAPKAATQSGSARVNAALAQGKSVVLLFAGSGADDSVAREVVRSVRGPRVTPIVASITDLGLYADVVANLDITAAPTIVVIAPSRQATRIVGLPDVKQVQSALRTLRGH